MRWLKDEKSHFYAVGAENVKKTNLAKVCFLSKVLVLCGARSSSHSCTAVPCASPHLPNLLPEKSLRGHEAGCSSQYDPGKLVGRPAGSHRVRLGGRSVQC